MLAIKRPATTDAALADGVLAATYDVDPVVLGRGGFSEVHACTHRPTGERRAVKVIDLRRFRLRPGFRAADVLDEVKVMRALSHPHIVRVYDSFEGPALAAADTVSIVTELAPGGELFDSIVQAGNFSEVQARHVTWQLLDALERCGGRGMEVGSWAGFFLGRP
jgi:calcium/calmodulin-dependent protein kinase I